MDKGRAQTNEAKDKMTMHKALYPRDGIERVYVSRKEGGGGGGPGNTEDGVDASI